MFKSKFIGSEKTAQDAQDRIFRNMSAGEKIKITSGFYDLAIKLNKLGKNYDPRRVVRKNSRNS